MFGALRETEGLHSLQVWSLQWLLELKAEDTRSTEPLEWAVHYAQHQQQQRYSVASAR